ncbi:hypothetical protein KTD33_02565 [Burkholderia gladioli]|uniref:hypothetical protein n=1 Tax=Burkholderia gladioli TaxID=28095 RepID=UPI001C24D45A|nr:hypothetical protein [Burkholderia gladioli]MBU9193412.1 hypothetical protein [Burkholderia gladioli]
MAEPILDFRSPDDFYRQALTLATVYTQQWSGNWPPPLQDPGSWLDPAATAAAVNQDPGLVLLNLFAQLGGYTALIENRIPYQRRQSFFQFLGLSPRPPQPARAPLAFTLKPGQGARLVPAQTAVIPPDAQQIRFQTEQDFTAMPARLTAAMTIMPSQDSYLDAMPAFETALAGADDPPGAALFLGPDDQDIIATPLGHWFMIGDANLFKPDPTPQRITITLVGERLHPDYFGQWFDAALSPLAVVLAGSDDARRLDITLPGQPLAPAVSIETLVESLYAREDPGAGFSDPCAALADPSTENWLLTCPAPGMPILSTLAGQLPIIDGCQCTLEGGQIQPQQAACNVVALDIANGAYPFGETPQTNDAFYVRSDAVFARTGARVSLDFDLAPVAQTYPVQIVWQFWDGSAWRPFNATAAQRNLYQWVDTTSNLQGNTSGRPTSIAFLCPAMKPVTVTGSEGLWIRAVIAAGGYGAPGGFSTSSISSTIDQVPDSILPPEQKAALVAWLNDVEGVNFSYQFSEAQFAPPFIRSLQLGYTYSAAPSRFWTYNAFAASRFLAAPYVPVDAELSGFYFAFEPAGFETDSVGRRLQLYLSIEGERAEPGRPLDWQYFDGAAWQPLPVDDGTYGLSRSGIVAIQVPADMPASPLYSQLAFWFRVENAHVERTIRVLGLYPNAVMAGNVTTIVEEVLGSSNQQPGQRFQIAYPPVLPELQLRVDEPRGIDDMSGAGSLSDSLGGTAAAGSAVTAATPGSDASGAAGARGYGERAGGTRGGGTSAAGDASPDTIGRIWTQVDNFALCGPSDRVYTLDCRNGLVSFGDGYNGMIPPAGYNNVVAARYDTTQGLHGNVGVNTLSLLRPGISGIDAVSNPSAARGGVDGDGADDIAASGPALVKADGYAVDLDDLAALAAQASQQVARARAIETPEQRIRIPLLARSLDPVPYTTPQTIETVAAAVRAQVLATLAPRIDFVAPSFVAVAVLAQVTANCAPDQRNALQLTLAAQLAAFLQPVFGGPAGQGWAFGEPVRAMVVNRFLRQLPGVTAVQALSLNGRANGDVALAPDQLPIAGAMTVRVTAATGGSGAAR